MKKKSRWLEKNIPKLRLLDKKYKKNLLRKRTSFPMSYSFKRIYNGNRKLLFSLYKKIQQIFPYFEFLHENNFKKIVKTQKKNLIKIEENIDVDYKKKIYFFV